jgi:hypothetical protein
VEGQVVSERIRAQGIDVAQGRLYLGNFGQGYRTVQAHDRIVAAREPEIIECEHAASRRGLGQAGPLAPGTVDRGLQQARPAPVQSQSALQIVVRFLDQRTPPKRRVLLRQRRHRAVL